MTKTIEPPTDLTTDDVPVDQTFFFPLGIVHPDPAQPRQHITPESVEELRRKIQAEGGLIYPLTVRPHPERADEWMIVDGGRRRAAAEGVLTEIECRIRIDLEDPIERLRVQLNANSGEPLSPLDEARAYQTMLDADENLSVVALSKMLGVSRSSIQDRIGLLTIGAWLPLLESGEITVSQAVELRRYAAVPEPYQFQAIKAAREAFRYSQAKTFLDLSVRGFADTLIHAYRDILFQLVDRQAYEHPGPLSDADLKRHDKECVCGRIRAFGGHRQNAVDCCANPEWWKPFAEQKAALQEAAESRRLSRKSDERQEKDDATRRLQLPEDVDVVKAYSEDERKNVIRLTSGYLWDIPHQKPFDPAELGLESSDLTRIVSPNRLDDEVGTRNRKKVRAAQKAWTERWEARRAELEIATRDAIEAAPTSLFYVRASAEDVSKWLVKQLSDGDQHGDGDRVVMIAACLWPELFVEKPLRELRDLAVAREFGIRSRVGQLADALSHEQRMTLINGIAVSVGLGLDPYAAWRKEQEGARLEASRRPNPFRPAPTDGQGNSLFPCGSCREFFPEAQLRQPNEQTLEWASEDGNEAWCTPCLEKHEWRPCTECKRMADPEVMDEQGRCEECEPVEGDDGFGEAQLAEEDLDDAGVIASETSEAGVA